jgi:hypothetical protein
MLLVVVEAQPAPPATRCSVSLGFRVATSYITTVPSAYCCFLLYQALLRSGYWLHPLAQAICHFFFSSTTTAPILVASAFLLAPLPHVYLKHSLSILATSHTLLLPRIYNSPDCPIWHQLHALPIAFCCHAVALPLRSLSLSPHLSISSSLSVWPNPCSCDLILADIRTPRWRIRSSVSETTAEERLKAQKQSVPTSDITGTLSKRKVIFSLPSAPQLEEIQANIVYNVASLLRSQSPSGRGNQQLLLHSRKRRRQ